jgi:Tfp pilus assembly protein PilN
MNNNINLISNQNVGLEKELRRLKQVRITSIICLVVVSLMSILIFVLNLTLPLDSVKKDQNTTAANIALLHQKLITYNLITDRVRNISGIISQREDYTTQLSQILGKLPAGVSMDGLQIDTGKITFSVSSTSLVSINQFIDTMVSFNSQGKIINNLVMQGLSLDTSSGEYDLNMQAGIL